MLGNLFGSKSDAAMPTVQVKEPLSEQKTAPRPPSQNRIVDRVAEISRFMGAFHANVSVDAGQFKADELRKLVAAARQNNVLISLRNIKLNPSVLGTVIGSDGKHIIVEM